MGFFNWKVAYGSGRMEGKEEDHKLSFVFINKIPRLVNARETNNFKPDISR